MEGQQEDSGPDRRPLTPPGLRPGHWVTAVLLLQLPGVSERLRKLSFRVLLTHEREYISHRGDRASV